uniref:Uncharacterized protein n=1 Tax=Leptocylindrus danicus TaxID=163516 RepID=A0A7S2PC90_9STRA|mmetsp:Transcript_27962/g.41223  ORF Transcript_27962/g.41223 Transcript_27962/m.41223 type:complete len:363 (+) Transcript_27962:102-1190(+)
MKELQLQQQHLPLSDISNHNYTDHQNGKRETIVNKSQSIFRERQCPSFYSDDGVVVVEGGGCCETSSIMPLNRDGSKQPQHRMITMPSSINSNNSNMNIDLNLWRVSGISNGSKKYVPPTPPAGGRQRNVRPVRALSNLSNMVEDDASVRSSASIQNAAAYSAACFGLNQTRRGREVFKSPIPLRLPASRSPPSSRRSSGDVTSAYPSRRLHIHTDDENDSSSTIRKASPVTGGVRKRFVDLESNTSPRSVAGKKVKVTKQILVWDDAVNVDDDFVASLLRRTNVESRMVCTNSSIDVDSGDDCQTFEKRRKLGKHQSVRVSRTCARGGEVTMLDYTIDLLLAAILSYIVIHLSTKLTHNDT